MHHTNILTPDCGYNNKQILTIKIFFSIFHGASHQFHFNMCYVATILVLTFPLEPSQLKYLFCVIFEVCLQIDVVVSSIQIAALVCRCDRLINLSKWMPHWTERGMWVKLSLGLLIRWCRRVYTLSLEYH